MKRLPLTALIASTILLLSLSSALAQYNWTNDPSNPRWTDAVLALEPAVLYDTARAKYDLWYSDWSNIKRLESSDGANWSYTGSTQNLASLFSTSIFGGAEVYKVNSTYYVYPWCQDQSGGWYIGLASSPDGNSWTKHSSSPALAKGAPGSWDDMYVVGARITRKDGICYMFYTGNGGNGNEVGLAISADGVHWEKYGGNPVIAAKAMGPNTATVGAVGVEFVDGIFYMVVSVTNSSNQSTYNLATSTDGISWSFYQSNPVLVPGTAGAWNSSSLGGGTLRYAQGKYLLWYCADDYSQNWRIGLASSSAGSPQEVFWHQTGGPLSTQDVRILASDSHGTLFAGTWTAGEVYKTTNDGNNWTVCGAIPNTNPILGLTVDHHDHIFASVFLRGIARSTDNGASWQMKNSGLTSLTVRWSILDRQDNVWVATQGGIFRTTDDGESWTMMKAGQFYNVWLDSLGAVVTQESDGTFDNLGNTNNYLYRSTDGGANWSSTYIPGRGIAGVHADGSYYANSYVGSNIYRSTDLGATWTDLHVPVSWSGYTTFTGFPSNGDVFFTMNGDAAGVLRSTDNGATWAVTNSGLTNLRVTCIYPHPDGYVFIGTGFTGVFRSTQPYAPPTNNINVSMPRIATAAGNEVEIPVTTTSLSGHGILSYEFTLKFNSPDGVLNIEDTPITAGTLMAANGWSVQINTTVRNQVTVGAYGAMPLFGDGVLLKLKARIAQNAAAGDSTSLELTNFVFNSGAPEPSLLNGGITIHERVCGDADENGSVQAYDAALTLREALGPMSSPPAPLTVLGRLNADVNQDGKVQAYDAALILRHAIGLTMPDSTVTCFGTGGVSGSPTSLALAGKVLGIEYGADHTAMLIGLTNVPTNMQVYSYSFELTCSAAYGDTTSLTLPTLEQSYMATVNRLGDGHFKVGIINPYGVDVKGILLTLAAKFASSLNQITISELMLNNVSNESIILRNDINSVEPKKETHAQSFDLIGAYPNPFNPSTRIVFQIPASAQVRLEVYNMQGIRIKTLQDEPMASGQHEIFWDGTNNLGQSVATGEYFCVMRAGSLVKTLRLMLLK